MLLDLLGKVKTPQNSPLLSSQLFLGYLAQQFFGKKVLILHEKAHSRPRGLREVLQATTCETEVDFLFTSHPWSPFFNPSQRSSVEEQRKKSIYEEMESTVLVLVAENALINAPFQSLHIQVTFSDQRA